MIDTARQVVRLVTPVLLLSSALDVAGCVVRRDSGGLDSAEQQANGGGAKTNAPDVLEPAKGGSPSPPDGAPLNRLALVYRGPVVTCEGCSEAIAAVLQKSKRGLDVKFVGPGEELELSASTLKSAALYAQPGGDGDVAQANDIVVAQLGGAAVMSDWVKAGGRFYGTCMGGFLATSPDERHPLISERSWGFGLLPGKVGEWIESRGASVTDQDDTMVELVWGGKTRWVYFQDGPHFLLDPGANAEVLATYASNGLPAVVLAPFGNGRVGLSGPHPEAADDWFTENGLRDPDDSDGSRGHARDLALELVEKLLE